MSAFDTLQKAVEELGDADGTHQSQINMLVAKRVGYKARLTPDAKLPLTLWMLYAPDGTIVNDGGFSEYSVWNKCPDYMGSTDAALTLLAPLQDGEHRIEIKWQSWNRWECLISNGWDVYVSCESNHLAHAIVKAWWAFEDALIEPSDEG